MSLAYGRYDKSAYSGRGDRADPSTWPVVSGPLDVVLFEGWMNGFQVLPDEEVRQAPGLCLVRSCPADFLCLL